MISHRVKIGVICCMKTKRSIIWKTENFAQIVAESYSFAQILKKIGFKTWSSIHYSVLRARIAEEGISVEHIGNGLSHKKGTHFKLSKKEALEKIFIKDSTVHQRTVRKYLKQYKLLKEICACGNAGEWQSLPLVLQLDHINGDNTDDRLENLRWICPNCHSQTETFGVRNVKNRTEFEQHQYTPVERD